MMYRIVEVFGQTLKDVCPNMNKEDFRKEVIIFAHAVNKGKFNSDD